MKITEIYEMVQILSKSDLGKLEIEDKLIESRLNLISNFVINLLDEYKEQLDILCNTNVRFCDYYDMITFHGDEIIQYFNDNYNGKDKEQLIDIFVLYVILKNVETLVYSYELSEGPEDLYQFLDFGNYFEDILTMINFLEKKRSVLKDYDGPEFLNPNNKYKILFSGFVYEDFLQLEKEKKRAFIKKISGQLATDDCVSLTKSIGHVKDLLDFPIMRVYCTDDHRIAYVRKDGVTVILGISMKTGRDKDYTRYDSVAEKKHQIYEEIRLFNSGKLPLNSQHYKTLQCILDFYNKSMTKIDKIEKVRRK